MTVQVSCKMGKRADADKRCKQDSAVGSASTGCDRPRCYTSPGITAYIGSKDDRRERRMCASRYRSRARSRTLSSSGPAAATQAMTPSTWPRSLARPLVLRKPRQLWTLGLYRPPAHQTVFHCSRADLSGADRARVQCFGLDDGPPLAARCSCTDGR